ncbi:MAG: pilus assembly protein TadG-related protein [Solirubrobacteraceae bacterium]
MPVSNPLGRLLREECGAVAITVGLLFPVFLLFGVLAVDVGNWYVHKRELQTQADAGALAGAAYFKYPCDDTPIAAAAQSYAGTDHNVFSNVPASRSTFLLNAVSFAGQAKPGDAGLTGSPCADSSVDVKMTERNVPWFFGTPLTPHINAQARVDIKRLEGNAGMLPVGVPIPDPKRVRATFISEVTGETLGYRDLCERSDPQSGMQIWDNAASNPAGFDTASGACSAGTAPAPLALTFNDPKYARVDVQIATSGSASAIACGQPLVACYSAGTTDGAGFIHGWSDQPAVTDSANSPPELRSTVLLPGSCGDAYFSVRTSACAIGLNAKVDFQPREYGASGTPHSTVSVKAVVGGVTYPLAWNAAAQAWSTSAIAVAPGSGALSATIAWEQTDNKVQIGSTLQTCTNKSNNPCKGTFPGTAQRTFAGSSSTSGPLGLVQVGDGSSTSGVTDVQRCSSSHPACTEGFVVTVGITGSLSLAKPSDPPIVLRVGGGGSQNQTIDCDPSISQLKDELALGCAPEYRRNTGQACPASSVFGTPTPWYCVGTQTGASVNQVSAGMNHRVLGSEKPATCSAPNHWPNYEPGDPRILPLFVVPFGAFQGSGNQTFPVQDFAFFYVTGWTGQGTGFGNPCQGNGDDPVPGNDAGSIVGHFIKYIETPNTGNSGDQPCDLSGASIGGCVAVMTK